MYLIYCRKGKTSFLHIDVLCSKRELYQWNCVLRVNDCKMTVHIIIVAEHLNKDDKDKEIHLLVVLQRN